MAGTKKLSGQTVSLQIEKDRDNYFYTTKLYSENGDLLAADNFQYELDVSIFTRLEDCAGKNVKANAKMITAFGSSLFNNVFHGDMLRAYRSLRHFPVRLKLIFENKQWDLLRAPWEFMFDGEDYLTASPGMTMTRALKRTPCNIMKGITGRSKALAVIPSVVDLPEFYRPQAEREHAIFRALMGSPEISGGMDLHLLEKASIENLKEKLGGDEYHILHFTSHGIYSQKEDACYVLLEDEFRGSNRVDAEAIAAVMAGHSSLRLVILSCYHSVMAIGHRVLNELAVSLLCRGVPAVIVMQYSVTEESLMVLSGQLFGGICRGAPIDCALANARRALLNAGDEGLVDFGSPILYGNNPDALFPKYPSARRS